MDFSPRGITFITTNEKTVKKPLQPVALAHSMSGGGSLFTKIIKGEIPASFIAKGEDWSAFLDINPRRAGHTLVVPHQQAQRISDIQQKQMHSLLAGVVEVQRKLSIFFNTTDFSIVIHDGPLAGQEIPHLHIHIIPRQKGDGGGSLLSMWPEAPPIGSVEPDFSALGILSEKINKL